MIEIRYFYRTLRHLIGRASSLECEYGSPFIADGMESASRNMYEENMSSTREEALEFAADAKATADENVEKFKDEIGCDFDSEFDEDSESYWVGASKAWAIAIEMLSEKN